MFQEEGEASENVMKWEWAWGIWETEKSLWLELYEKGGECSKINLES